MYYYRMYGLTLCSEIDFMQLVEEKAPMDEANRVYITEEQSPDFAVNKIVESGKKVFIGEHEGWLENKTLYMLIENGNRIRFFKKEGANEIYVRTYILGFGMAMLAFQRDMLAIHCSVVKKNGRAILLCGESGAGKSTVTSAFLSEGYALMADDMAFVKKVGDELLVWPAFPYQKKCRDEVEKAGYQQEEIYYIDEDKDKYLVPYKGEFGLEPVCVSGMIYLALKPDGAMETAEITGFQKFHFCANNLFLRHLLRDDKYQPFIGEKCLQMASLIPIQILVRSFAESTPEDTAKKVLEIAESFSKKG